ncbi:PIG-L deacetylase family protein [Cognataquiflexum aquatile]|uniref:PIG-L deacetylase family protein n=1 Tax=Cognataquiflexum aquatile TaxID=2249427 RepID=UPI0018E54146|nr:PIG-L deacetylase family protein [Cognataquiflexum aquatile]
MKNVIVISAHPDDETLGVGGTLLKHKEIGDKLFWIIATKISEDEGFSKERVNSRQDEIEKVSRRFGFEEVFFLNYSTMSLSSSSVVGLVPRLSKIFQEIKPEILFSLNRSDAHSDHRYLSDAVMACTKSFRYPFLKKVLMYECLSETEFAPAFPEKVFLPNYFVDISEFLEKKIEIMRIYSSELGDHPFPRSERNIRALATYRGAVAGCEYAEAFQIVKIID